MKRLLIIRLLSTFLLIFSFLWFIRKDGKKMVKLLYKKFHYIVKKILNASLKSKESILNHINRTKKTNEKTNTTKESENLNSNYNIENNDNKKNKEKLQPKKPNKKHQKIIDKLLSKADFYKKKGQLKQYERKLIEGLAIDPDNLECNKQLALFYHNTEDDKKAILLLKKIINIEPNDHETLWQLGDIYLVQGEFDTAKKLINDALSMSKDRPKYYISMVEVYYNEGDIKEAIGYMHKAISLRPRNTTYIMGIAGLYEESEDIESAKKYYFQVLELEPNNMEAKKKLNSL